MMKYEKPSYDKEAIETEDVILASLAVQIVGEGSIGNISGTKGQLSMNYSDLFGNR